MIAVVSSTIFPLASRLSNGDTRSVLDPAERLRQTELTVASLLAAGIEDIFIFDNSGSRWKPEAELRLGPAKVFVSGGFQFQNKGISEILLLLELLEHLPCDQKILKISGRYQISKLAELDDENWDIAGRAYHKRRHRNISTRAYYVRNREVLGDLLTRTLREVYAFPGRLVGSGSLLRILRNLFSVRYDYCYESPHISIEESLANVVFGRRFNFVSLDKLDVSGQFGNFHPPMSIEE